LHKKGGLDDKLIPKKRAVDSNILACLDQIEVGLDGCGKTGKKKNKAWYEKKVSRNFCILSLTFTFSSMFYDTFNSNLLSNRNRSA
jgi:hypothetical protein